jgi:hypothetical protein
MLSQDEKVAFDVYFASVTSMQFHPGSGKKDHEPLSLDDCRDVAMKMIEIRRNLIGSD